MPLHKKQRRSSSASVSEPTVGIFWLVGEKLVFDVTPLSQAEDYGDFKIHSGNHVSVWERLRVTKIVPVEMEYEEAPRGRVMYDVKNHLFSLLADPCILRRKEIVAKIKREMNLPKGRSTSVDTDYHYRCHACLYGIRGADCTEG